jgi:16S rRNA processing protein RimM
MPEISRPEQPAYLALGRVLRPHGVRGELRVSTITDYPERVAELETVFLSRDVEGADAKPYLIESVRLHQDYILIKFENVPDRNAAERLRDLYVLVDIEHAVPLDDDEVYLYELIGLTVKLEDGTVLGTLTDIMETGANDVYVINSDTHGSILIPAHDETIVEIDLDEEVITVAPPPGSLPWDAEE